MECGVQHIQQQQAAIAMISVPPSGGDAANQPLSTFPQPDADQAQFEADKRAVYKHPLFPLLALLFERCELATQSSDIQSSDAFNLDIQAFVQHQERDRKPFLANEPEIDGLMIKAIQVLRIHLLELEKVQELCKDFCNRYITCLKGKMQSENLLRSDYPQDVLGPGNLMNNLESNNNNNNNSMMSHGNSDSGGSASNSPVQYSISPSQPQMVTSSSQNPTSLLDTSSPSSSILGGAAPSYHHYAPPIIPPPLHCDTSLVVHGSTPLSQIGIAPPTILSSCSSPSDPANALSATPLSPAPTTPGGCGSADDCDDSDITSTNRGSGAMGGSGRKHKRGVLPKHATGVMRSWLFQHLVHPYPTEDEKRHIAAQTNLTLLQVNNWFINARRRILQPMLDASTPPDGALNATCTNSSSSSNGATSSTTTNNRHHKKKKGGAGGAGGQNNNRRYWPQDFVAAAAAAVTAAAGQIGGVEGVMQQQAVQMDNVSNMLMSSEDEDDDDSYSSDGEDGVGGAGGGGPLIIDSSAVPATVAAPSSGEASNQNGYSLKTEEGATSAEQQRR